MKLRNKKTGEILETGDRFLHMRGRYLYTSLTELNEEWEDYKEPKKYWFIDAYGNIVQNKITKHRGDAYTDMSSDYETQKQIGNWFETKEEAEKVVALLKRIAIIKSYGCNVYEYINNTVLSIEDYYERNKDEKRICR